jgi:two-component sensor histidine kinase
LSLLVADNGVGFPAGFDLKKIDTLGLELVSTLTDQLDGTLERVRKTGSHGFKITFPG